MYVLMDKDDTKSSTKGEKLCIDSDITMKCLNYMVILFIMEKIHINNYYCEATLNFIKNLHEFLYCTVYLVFHFH